jgi:hypothetical protein
MLDAIETVPEFKYLGQRRTDGESDPELRGAGSVTRRRSSHGDGDILQSRRPICAIMRLRVIDDVPFRNGRGQAVKLSLTLLPVRNEPAHSRKPRRSVWICPSSAFVLESAGLWPIQEHIRCRRAAVMQFATSRYVYQQNYQHPLLYNTSTNQLPCLVDLQLNH